MANEKKLGIVFTSDTSAARKGIADLNNALGTTEQKAKSSGAGLKTALGGLAIGAFVLDGVRALGEVERINAQTSAALKSTGAEAWITADAVNGLATSIEKKTGIEAESIQSGQNLLLTFTNIQNAAGEGNDIFDQATKTMADMSTAMGTDASTSAMQLGKALNDPIKGISALSKVGVTFTADQKAMVAEMVAAGDTMGAQKVILAELNKEFGGSAEAFGETLPGQIAKAKNSLGDMQESILVGALPAIEAGTKAVGGFADAYASLPAPVRTVTTLAVVGAAGWMRFGDSISTFGGHAANAAKKGADLARTLSQGLDGVAATRGISKTAAAVEMLKSSASNAAAPTGKVSSAINNMSTGAFAGTVAVAGLSAGLAVWQYNAARAEAKTKQLADAINSISDEATQTGKTVEEVFSNSALPTFVGDNAKMFEAWGIDIAELNDALLSGDKEWQNYLASMPKNFTITPQLELLRGSLEGARLATSKQAEANDALGLTIDPLTGKTVALADATSGASEAFAGMGESLGGIGDKFGEIPGAAEAARSAISAFYDELSGNLEAQIAVEGSLQSFAESLKTNGASLDISTAAGNANAQSMLSVRDAAVQAAMEIYNQTGSAEQATAVLQGYSDRLNDTANSAHVSEAELAFMNETIGLTPEQIEMIIKTNAKAVTTDIDAFGIKVTQLPDGHVKVTADTSAAHAALNALASRISSLGATLSANLRQITINASQNARGGPVEKGEWSLVGEEGPELVIFGQDGVVLDAAKTRAMLNGEAGAQGMKAGPAKYLARYETPAPGPIGGSRIDPSAVAAANAAALAPAAPAAAAKPSEFDLTDIGSILERGLKAQARLQKSTDEHFFRLTAHAKAAVAQLELLNGNGKGDTPATKAAAAKAAKYLAQYAKPPAQQNGQRGPAAPQRSPYLAEYTQPAGPIGGSRIDPAAVAAANAAALAPAAAATPAKASEFDLVDIGQILERGLKAQTALQKSVDGGVIGGIKTLNGWPPIQSVQLGLIHQAITSLGSRAGGGKVRGGTAYLVGEEGPEFAVFGRDGLVLDAPTSAGMVARAGRSRIAGGGTQIVVNIHPNAVRGDGDIKQIVDGINRLGLTSSRPLLAAGIAG